MTYKLSISPERVKYILREMGDDRVKIIREGDHFTQVEITIRNGFDALSLFHAGVMSGLNATYPKVDGAK
jgi:hypothetical protein